MHIVITRPLHILSMKFQLHNLTNCLHTCKHLDRKVYLLSLTLQTASTQIQASMKMGGIDM